jgi:hypothetical protein
LIVADPVANDCGGSDTEAAAIMVGRVTAGNQAAQDRSGPPTGQDYVLLVQ